MRKAVRGVLFLFLVVPAVLSPAAASDVGGPLKVIAFIPAVTGSEQALTAKIATLLPEVITAEVDNLGSLYGRLGRGAPVLGLVAGADEFGYVVSAVTEDGYLRLDRAVPPPLALSDTFLLGRPVVVGASAGIVPGVVSQPSLHLMTPESRDLFAKPLTLDQIYVDIGARTADEVKSRGVAMLDPVTWTPALSVLAGSRRAGPGLGRRAACAVLVAAAQDPGLIGSAPVELAWMAQSRMFVRAARSSLGALRARGRLTARSVVVVDSVPAGLRPDGPRLGGGPVIVGPAAAETAPAAALERAAASLGLKVQRQTLLDSPLLAPFLGTGGEAAMLAVPVRYAGTPSEIVDLKDVQAAADILVALVKKGGRS
jgi:putative aminopeptidase FrvX